MVAISSVETRYPVVEILKIKIIPKAIITLPKFSHKKTAAFAAALHFLLEFIFYNGIGFGFQSVLAFEAG